MADSSTTASGGGGAGGGAPAPVVIPDACKAEVVVAKLNEDAAAGRDMLAPEYAAELDAADHLAEFREEFHFPPTRPPTKIRPEDSHALYLCGNSLGLQPKNLRGAINEELDKWAERGVTGHFTTGRPWVTVDEIVVEQLARLVGALPVEVAAMNTLTCNLHLLMVPFYRPTADRYKILAEAKSFPSDYYAFESQIRFHGYDPKDALIEMSPREGEKTIRTEDIEALLAERGSEIAVVLFSGVQYYTGQAFEMDRITKAGHDAGCMVGFDCAHAAGNLELKLHDWDVDFAVFCSYKYLNSGPGGIGGAFVHERHARDTSRPRFAGWWGTEKSDRFKMAHEFKPTPGAFGYQLSNPSVFTLAALDASLQLFDKASMRALRNKAVSLTRYLEILLTTHLSEYATIITPTDPEQRGCQLSVEFSIDLHSVHQRLDAESVIVDIREPSAMRVAPAPLYNSYSDVAEFVRVLKAVIAEAEAAGATTLKPVSWEN